jgi:hypothetical protein
MKKFIRKTRLVLACMNLTGGICRLLAALVNVAFNYPGACDTEVDPSVRNQAGSMGFCAY